MVCEASGGVQVVSPGRKVHRLQVHAAPAGAVLPVLCVPEGRLRHVRQADPGHQEL